MEEKLYNAAGTFSNKDRQLLTKINQIIVEAGGDKISFFQRDDKHPVSIPHLSLYRSVVFATDKISITQEILKNILAHGYMPKLNVQKIYEGSYGYVMMAVDKSNIMDLHKEIVINLNSIREGRVRMKYQGIEESDIEAGIKEMIKKYGTVGVMESFDPHITLGILPDKLEGSARENLVADLPWVRECIAMPFIGLYLMGSWGNCVEELFKIPFIES